MQYGKVGSHTWTKEVRTNYTHSIDLKTHLMFFCQVYYLLNKKQIQIPEEFPIFEKKKIEIIGTIDIIKSGKELLRSEDWVLLHLLGCDWVSLLIQEHKDMDCLPVIKACSLFAASIMPAHQQKMVIYRVRKQAIDDAIHEIESFRGVNEDNNR